MQKLLLDHARSCVGIDRVQNICRTLMQLYFGISSKTGQGPDCTTQMLSHMLLTLQPSARKEVKCSAMRQSENLPTWNAWQFLGNGSTYAGILLESDGLTFHELVSTLPKYGGLFRQEMRWRGLVLHMDPPQWTCSPYTGGAAEIWTFSLLPEPAVWIAREN